MRLAASSAAPPLTSTPSSAPRPVPTATAAGVARPSAHGQAITSTATKRSTALANPFGGGIDERPHEQGHQRESEDDRDEPAADDVGQAGDRRARALGLLDGLDDPRERRVAAGAGDADRQRAAVVLGAAVDRRAGLLVDRQALAGQHRLVDRGAAAHDLAVAGDPLARADEHEVAGDERLDRHVLLELAADPAGGPRRERDQAADRVGQAPAGPRLHQLAEQDEAQDRRGCLEVQVRQRAVLRVREQARRDEGDRRVAPRREHAEADQRVHVGGAVAQRGPGEPQEAAAGAEHDRGRQGELQPASRTVPRSRGWRRATWRRSAAGRSARRRR
jgi:hypothetical protein